MVAEVKANGKTVLDEINEIYGVYCYYRNILDSFILNGEDGLAKISFLIRKLRLSGSPFEGIASVTDYSRPVNAEESFGTL